MAFMIHCADQMAGTKEHETLQRRNTLPDALRRAQEMIRDRLRAGYYHADYLDHWTILKRGNDIFRIRLEMPRTHVPVVPKADTPLLWARRN